MNKYVVIRTLQVALTLVLQAVLLFLSAGTVRWTWAWVFMATGVFILFINCLVLPPEVIEERAKKKKNVKKWDRILTGINILPTILLYVVCGLDFRFGWTTGVSVVVNVSGLTIMFAGAMLFTWGMVSNKFFSTMVRIQDERDHSVATGGPYKYVRHPGYVGYMMMSAGTPLALGSYWALSFSGITFLIFIIRTRLEDETLKKELDGYSDYTRRVRYRLVPGLW